jgi:hypothetical protein
MYLSNTALKKDNVIHAHLTYEDVLLLIANLIPGGVLS